MGAAPVAAQNTPIQAAPFPAGFGGSFLEINSSGAPTGFVPVPAKGTPKPAAPVAAQNTPIQAAPFPAGFGGSFTEINSSKTRITGDGDSAVKKTEAIRRIQEALKAKSFKANKFQAPTAQINVVVPPTQAGPYIYYYQNYFVGHWNAVGYTCTKNTPKIEKIAITNASNKMIATKLT